MTAAQLADKLMSQEHADVLRGSVAWMAAQLMEAEVALCQAALEFGDRRRVLSLHRHLRAS